ncbi:unnamed protein product [Urochloa decumbens]|uniref:GRF-type domain-containing protein n=2 Tax=Urochloa decumbens TaxID=240449 RepID=A0ABC9C6G5_9POAL
MHAMGGDSSGSTSDPQGGGGLPLIWCTECGRSQVLRRISQKPWSLGHVFYCCPFYKRNGTGCPFWFWEEDYAVVAENGGNAAVERVAGQGFGTRNRFARGAMDGRGAMLGKAVMQGDWNKENELVCIGKEVVRFLKAICLLCGCLLFVMFLILVVQVMK